MALRELLVTAPFTILVMRVSTLLILILLLAFAASCGKPTRSSGRKYIKITAEQIAFVMDHQVMNCASINGTGCPDGVARLLVLNRNDAERSYVCSGFMVKDNILVTNHHCISNQTECNNAYIAVYDGYGRYHQTKCKSIINAKEDYVSASDPRRAIDYAVIEVEDQYNGGLFTIAANRANFGDSVTAWVVDHTGLDDLEEPNFYESRITEFRCKVENQNESASMVLENCPIIHGNSGSPAVNSAGQIIGVIWGATEADVNSQTDLVTRRNGTGLGIVTEMIHFAGFTII